MYVCTYVCMYVRMHVCIYVYMYMLSRDEILRHMPWIDLEMFNIWTDNFYLHHVAIPYQANHHIDRCNQCYQSITKQQMANLGFFRYTH